MNAWMIAGIVVVVIVAVVGLIDLVSVIVSRKGQREFEKMAPDEQREYTQCAYREKTASDSKSAS